MWVPRDISAWNILINSSSSIFRPRRIALLRQSHRCFSGKQVVNMNLSITWTRINVSLPCCFNWTELTSYQGAYNRMAFERIQWLILRMLLCFVFERVFLISVIESSWSSKRLQIIFESSIINHFSNIPNFQKLIFCIGC